MSTLTNRTIRSTYGQLVQLEDTLIQDGFGTHSLNGSYNLTGSQFISGNLHINGTASIDYIVSSYESSSIIYSSGSTKFGDDTSDTHEFTGSVTISGSAFSTNWSGSFTGSFIGLADSASNAARAVSASQADNATTASIADKASNLSVTVEDSSAATHYVIFGPNTTGETGPKTDSALNYLPQTETLTATKFLGQLEGSASYASTASVLLGAVISSSHSETASLAISTSVQNITSQSFASSGDGPFTGSFSSSLVSFLSGSFTGSSTGSFFGILTGTASQADNATTASHALTAVTASHALTAVTSSFANKADEAVTSNIIPVTVVSDGGNKYAFNGVTAPNLTLNKGELYRFDLSDSSNSGHPFAFRLPDDTSYTVGVTTVGSAGSAGAYVDFDVNFATSASLKYYCTTHGNGMGNTIQLLNSFDSVSTGSFSGSFSGSFTGDGSLLTGSYTVANSSNNRVITSVDDVNGNAETNLTFDGTTLTIVGNINTGQGVTEVYRMNQDVRTSDDVSFNSITETSTLKYKENIETLDSGDVIHNLRPVTFDWKESGERDYGLIAEEVNEHLPELVKKSEEGEVEGIKYTKLTSLLIKAVQDQQNQIAELTRRVNWLDNHV